ncbi:PseG/SpsG family protein [Kribbella deserti]|uniref:PseG/SpsG family protein n=1 Tax=Kribbella deserti TaxID=1926257 RepID=A0ABV6QSR3_9ACTN
MNRVKVGVRCDVGPQRGVGHVMRCLALAEELAARGAEVVFVCDSHTVPWADEQLRSRGFQVEPAVFTPAEHVELFRRLAVDAVVFDSYDLGPEPSTAVHRAGWPTLAITDGTYGAAEADIYVDQNLGAEVDGFDLPAGAVRLAGLDYVMLRDEVLRLRPAEPGQRPNREIPKVFAFFGGTDAYSAGPPIVRALAATGVPFDATVVAPRAELVEEIATIALGERQTVTTIGPTSELAKAVVESDLVIGASGTSTWELLCLGGTAGLVCVVDNQVLAYEGAVATKAAAGVGVLSEIQADPEVAAGVLRDLLTDSAERVRLAKAGWQLVDGLGRRRVVDVLLRQLSS